MSYFMQRQQNYRGRIARPFSARFTASRRVPPTMVKLEGNRTISVDEAAFAMELMLSPTALQMKTEAGERSSWFGWEVLQNPMDSAAIAAVLEVQRPDLLLEIGTECGGSALFLLTLMKMHNKNAKLVTWDVVERHKRHCPTTQKRKGYRQPAYKRFVAEGSLVPRVADVTAPAELALARAYAKNATRVMVIDDGDHTTTPLLVHFHHLARLVSPGSYYLVQDTRLDRNCRAARDIVRKGVWTYCWQILGADGGPGRAVHVLENEVELFRSLGFRADRSAERYVYTQHPGGWLRRGL